MSALVQSIPILLEMSSTAELEKLIAPSPLENNPDVIILNQNDDPVTIEVIRSLPQVMAQQPVFHQYKWIIIHHLDLANEVAQNALLKSLEDHPSYVRFLLTCQHANGILGTIRSRCHLHYALQSAENSLPKLELTTVLTATAGQKIALCESISTVAQAVSALSELLTQQHHLMEKQPSATSIENIKTIQQGLTMALANTSPRACVEWTLLHLK